MTTPDPKWKPQLTDDETCAWILDRFREKINRLQSCTYTIGNLGYNNSDWEIELIKFEEALDDCNEGYNRFKLACDYFRAKRQKGQ